MAEKLTKEKIEGAFAGYMEKAKAVLNDDEKIDAFLIKLENKLKEVPVVGTQLADIIILAELVKAYVKKEYREISTGSIVIALATLIYFVTPIDLIPDMIPIMGFADDIAILVLAMNFIHDDLQQFKAWQQQGEIEEAEAEAEEAVDAEIIEEE